MLDSQPPPPSVVTPLPNPAPDVRPGEGMPVDVASASAPAQIQDVNMEPKVLKIIKKLEVHVLCAQHNPVCLFLFGLCRYLWLRYVYHQAVAAAKKASKQDKIKNDLLALPPMARIKIRVSAGVFEVSLLRVMEETSSVEVLWDRGMKREFKWGSVVFGSIEGQNVVQKPSEFAMDGTKRESRFLVDDLVYSYAEMTFVAGVPSLPPTYATSSGPTSTHTPTHFPVPLQYPPYVPGSSYATGAWSYQPPAELRLKQMEMPVLPAPPKQPYNSAYYRTPGPPSLLDKDGRPQPLPPLAQREAYYSSSPNQYRAQLQWQQPYNGQRPGTNHYKTDGQSPPLQQSQNGDVPQNSEYGSGNDKQSAVVSGSQLNGENLDVRAALEALFSYSSQQAQQIQTTSHPDPDASGSEPRNTDGSS